MNRPIIDALKESLEGLEISFSPTKPSFKRDRIKTSNVREKSVSAFLESYFPRDWSVKKGPIFDNHGNVSSEVDCALCISQHPPCQTPKRDLILAEGVYAGIEVKPNIKSLGKKSEFARALDQGFTVKNLKRDIVSVARVVREEWPEEAKRIPYIIFAKEISDLEGSVKFIQEKQIEDSWSKWDLPDIILGYKKGLIFHVPEVSMSNWKEFFKKNGAETGEVYLVLPSGLETLFFFLTILYSFKPPQPYISKPILIDYLLPLDLPPGTRLLGSFGEK